LRRYLFDYVQLFAVAGLVLALDQVTKSLVRAALPYGAVWSPWEWLAPYARIVHWGNTGVAFGMFQEGGGFFTLLAILVAGVIVYVFPRIPREDWLMRLVIGMMLGGALGNLVDRLTIGHVTDFISVGTFPVFNLADASISIGAVVMAILSYVRDRQHAAAEADGVEEVALEEAVHE